MDRALDTHVPPGRGRGRSATEHRWWRRGARTGIQPAACVAMACSALLPALLALVVYGRTVKGFLLSDDLPFTTAQFASGSERVDWALVGSLFHEPWLFGDQGLYRPLASVVYALPWALGGGSSAAHAANIAAFITLVFLFAWFVGMLARRPLAALLGGLVVAAHPAAHEPVCWVCAQSELLMAIAACVAAMTFLAGLRGHGRRWYVAAGVASTVALFARENAVLLPVLFLLLDALERGPGALGRWRRLRVHLALAPIWIGYVVLRWSALDALIGGYGQRIAGQTTWANGAEVLLSRAVATFAPVHPTFPAWATACMGVGLLVAWLVGAYGRLLAVTVAWLVASWLPAPLWPVQTDLFGARLVMQGTMALAVGIGVGWARAASLGRRAVVVFAVGVAMAGMLAITGQTISRYERAWGHMRDLHGALLRSGSTATDRRPLALVFAATGPEVRPFADSFMLFPLLERPLAPRDVPFVSLGAVVTDYGPISGLASDAAPLRAMWWHGAELAYWSSTLTGGRLQSVAPPQPRTVVWRARGGGVFACNDGPLPVWHVERLTVSGPGPFGPGRLSYLSRHGELGALPVPAATRRGDRYAAEVDASHDAAFLFALEQHAGLAAVRLELPDVGGYEAFAIRSHPRVALLDVAEQLQGATVPLSSLAARLRPPDLPTEVPAERRTRLVLMNAVLSLAIPCDENGLAPRGDQQRLLREFRRFVHRDVQYCYWEVRGAGVTWRSGVDWFVLDATR